jgi:hypothetical protein
MMTALRVVAMILSLLHPAPLLSMLDVDPCFSLDCAWIALLVRLRGVMETKWKHSSHELRMSAATRMQRDLMNLALHCVDAQPSHV